MKNVDRYVAEPLEASVIVMPKGASKTIIARGAAGEIAGSAAPAAVDTAAAHGKSGPPLEAGTTSLGILALTADDVVLLNGRRGMVKPVATGLADRRPRGGLADVELGSGKLTAPLNLRWADGSTWTVDVPRGEAKRARTLVERLGG
jgi:hypothetical protein